jgi:hypothetical protein
MKRDALTISYWVPMLQNIIASSHSRVKYFKKNCLTLEYVYEAITALLNIGDQ